MYCYPDLVLVGSLGTAGREKIKVIASPDADLNSDINASRPTSRCFIEIVANGRFMPLAWRSRMQHCTATHTCEAETVSLAEAVREVTLIQDLFGMALNYPVDAILKEDNAAALISANKGCVQPRDARPEAASASATSATSSVPRLSPAVAPSQWRSKRLRPTVVTMFTKSLDPGKYSSALKMIGVVPYADRPSRTRPP